MKIYAIRDRLIDYFQQPFAGPDDKNVLASVARLINNGEITSDIAQAPHHFEIWELGEIDQEGHINATRKLVADCGSLVRPNIRERDDRRRSEDGPAARNGQEPTPMAQHTTGAAQRPSQAAPPATEDATLYASPPPTRPVN